MRVMITGGAGYVGSALVPYLLEKNVEVAVYDTFWFGDHLPNHPLLTRYKHDIRDLPAWQEALADFKPRSVLHLACISNDPSFELDESLSRTINYECFEALVIAAKEAGVKQFVYCSSSSVYGVSDAPDVREDHPLVPLTLYNKFKGMCEPLLFKHQSPTFVCTTIRPSTVCGYAPRQRLDLAVNIMTNLAIMQGKITVYGGAQKRPNLHIQDMIRCYWWLLTADFDKIQGQTYNVGAKNLTIMEIAEIAKAEVEAFLNKPGQIPIEVEPIHDTRSYQVNSDKIANELGFTPVLTVADAVRDLCAAYENHLIKDPMHASHYNVKWMRHVLADIYKDAPPETFDPLKGHLSEIDVHHRGAGK